MLPGKRKALFISRKFKEKNNSNIENAQPEIEVFCVHHVVQHQFDGEKKVSPCVGVGTERIPTSFQFLTSKHGPIFCLKGYPPYAQLA